MRRLPQFFWSLPIDDLTAAPGDNYPDAAPAQPRDVAAWLEANEPPTDGDDTQPMGIVIDVTAEHLEAWTPIDGDNVP